MRSERPQVLLKNSVLCVSSHLPLLFPSILSLGHRDTREVAFHKKMCGFEWLCVISLMTYLKLVSFGYCNLQFCTSQILSHRVFNAFCFLRIILLSAEVTCKPHCNQLGESSWFREHFVRRQNENDRWWRSHAAELGSSDWGLPKKRLCYERSHRISSV